MSEHLLFVKRLGLIGITDAFIRVRGLVLIPLLTKTLGAEGYGIWSQVMITLQLLSPLIVMNLPTAMMRFLAAKKDKKEIGGEFYSTVLIIGLISLLPGLFMILFADEVSNFLFGSLEYRNIVFILAILLSLWALDGTLLTYHLTFRKIKKYSVFIIFQTICEIAFVGYAVIVGYDAFGVIAALLGSRALLFVILALDIASTIGIHVPSFKHFPAYFTFALPLLPAQFSGWVIASSDRYMINYFLGLSEVGIYSAAYGIAGIVGIYTAGLGSILLPTLSKIYDENNMEVVEKYLSYLVKYYLLIGIPSVFGIFVLSRPLLHMVTTESFLDSGTAVIPVVALSLLIYGGCTITNQPIALAKKTALIPKIWGLSSVINFVLNLLLIPISGILGAALATLLAYAFGTVLVTYYSLKLIPFEIKIDSIIKSIFASLMMTVVIIRIECISIEDVFLLIAVGALIYGIVLFSIKTFEKNEINDFKRMLS